MDLHIHLRNGALMQGILNDGEQHYPLYESGIHTCLVMPNLVPPIATAEMAIEYWRQLVAAEPRVNYLMTLYLNEHLTPAEIHKAAAHGIVGVKSYPRGVTTNSDQGVSSFTAFYPVFEAMQSVGMVLNIHGESLSDPERNICVMNAEEDFLGQLRQLHRDFPRLKIVLEHATTAAAVRCVQELGDTVGCTITAHHLYLTVDDWAGKVHNYCKPVAKYPSDRQALRAIVSSGHPRFFMGSDSAPHPKHAKESACPCAGVYTTPHLLGYVADIFAELGVLNRLDGFIQDYGAAFYGETLLCRAHAQQQRLINGQPLIDTLKQLDMSIISAEWQKRLNQRRVRISQQAETEPGVWLVEKPATVPKEYLIKDSTNGFISVVPFKAGQTVEHSVQIKL